MTENELRVPFSDILKELDTEEQIYGCRANNSDICANNFVQGICVFTSNDCV